MTPKCPPHRWRIESPNGNPELQAFCVHCKAMRKYPAVEAPLTQRDPRHNARIFDRQSLP